MLNTHKKVHHLLQHVYSELVFVNFFRLLNDWFSILAVPFVRLLELNATSWKLVSGCSASDYLGQELVHCVDIESTAHRRYNTLIGRDSYDSRVTEAKVKSPLDFELVTRLKPEESEWLASVALGDLHN